MIRYDIRLSVLKTIALHWFLFSSYKFCFCHTPFLRFSTSCVCSIFILSCCCFLQIFCRLFLSNCCFPCFSFISSLAALSHVPAFSPVSFASPFPTPALSPVSLQYSFFSSYIPCSCSLSCFSFIPFLAVLSRVPPLSPVSPIFLLNLLYPVFLLSFLFLLYSFFIYSIPCSCPLSCCSYIPSLSTLSRVPALSPVSPIFLLQVLYPVFQLSLLFLLYSFFSFPIPCSCSLSFGCRFVP